MPKGRAPGRYVGKDRPPPDHGTRARYVAGCHCGRCSAENRDYQREYMSTWRAKHSSRDGLTVSGLKRELRQAPGLDVPSDALSMMSKAELVQVYERVVGNA